MEINREKFLVHLEEAASNFKYYSGQLKYHIAQLANKTTRLQVSTASIRSIMSDVTFLQAYMAQVAEGHARLTDALGTLRALHSVGSSAFGLTPEEFTTTTKLHAETYENVK